MRKSPSSIAALVVFLGACASSPATSPQSPTNDVTPPTTTTGNGEVIGADRVPPGQKLQEGLTLDGQDGIQPAAQPPKE